MIFGPALASTAGDPNEPIPSDADIATVISLTDGDTLDVTLVDGTTDAVRLIGINSPETGECWSNESTLALAAVAPVGSQIGLTTDVSDRDQFDRLLRYLWVGGLHVNEELVRKGAAISRRYPPDTAMAQRFESSQIEAQSNSLGLWAPDACGPAADADLRIVDLVADTQGDDNQNLNEELVKIRNMGANLVDMTGWGIKDESSSNRYTFPIGFSLAPGEVVTVYSGCGDNFGTDLFWCSVGSAIWNNDGDTVFLTDPAGNTHATRQYTPPTTTSTTQPRAATSTSGGGGNCHSSYPTVCIPPPPPDLNCGDISHRRFQVVGSDPHGFDGDNDGIGCES